MESGSSGTIRCDAEERNEETKNSLSFSFCQPKSTELEKNRLKTK